MTFMWAACSTTHGVGFRTSSSMATDPVIYMQQVSVIHEAQHWKGSEGSMSGCKS